MREPTITRNYAEALLELGRRANDLRGYGQLIDEMAAAVGQDASLRVFLGTPRVSIADKNKVLGQAFESKVPRPFMRFLQALVSNRRQMLIPQIAADYRDLLDEAEGRVHASVTIARDADEGERKAIADKLSAAIGKTIVPHFEVNPRILGGMVARIGDTVLDGSVRKRLSVLRAKMA